MRVASLPHYYALLPAVQLSNTVRWQAFKSLAKSSCTLSLLCQAEPPAQPVSRQRVDDDSFYDHDSSNPFNEPDEAGTHTPPGNPFDEPDQDTDPLQLDPEPPKPRQRKGVRPVDMSKYLYADTSHNEEDELDE